MELEKRFEKWDSLFEELKEVVETHLPEIKSLIEKSVSKVSTLEERISLLEDQFDQIRNRVSQEEREESLTPESLGTYMDDMMKTFHSMLSELKADLRNEFNARIDEIRHKSEETDVSEIKNVIGVLEKEIKEIRILVDRLSSEMEQIKNQMVEKHRVLRERKVEGKSPRIF